MSGLMCALAGMIWLGRFTSIKYDAGTSLNLKGVTIVVLGGTSILGGSGEILSTLIAALIVAVLNSGLTVLNIPIDTQIIVQGTVLIVSLIAYSLLNERVRQKQIIKLSPIADTATDQPT
jgi:ribose/xylose/arabinose/galactoside ABC-type transport system permease subunit